MAKIALEIYDYAHFVETCLDRFNLIEVNSNCVNFGEEITIEGDIEVIKAYLKEEYCVGMEPEDVEAVLAEIRD